MWKLRVFIKAQDSQMRVSGNELHVSEPNPFEGNKWLSKSSFWVGRRKTEISVCVRAVGAMWWLKRPFVCSQIPAASPGTQWPNNTQSGTGVMLSGRNSLITCVGTQRNFLNTWQLDHCSNLVWWLPCWESSKKNCPFFVEHQRVDNPTKVEEGFAPNKV